jgi:hypothetical protein
VLIGLLFQSVQTEREEERRKGKSNCSDGSIDSRQQPRVLQRKLFLKPRDKDYFFAPKHPQKIVLYLAAKSGIPRKLSVSGLLVVSEIAIFCRKNYPYHEHLGP